MDDQQNRDVPAVQSQAVSVTCHYCVNHTQHSTHTAISNRSLLILVLSFCWHYDKTQIQLAILYNKNSKSRVGTVNRSSCSLVSKLLSDKSIVNWDTWGILKNAAHGQSGEKCNDSFHPIFSCLQCSVKTGFSCVKEPKQLVLVEICMILSSTRQWPLFAVL